MLVYYYYYYYYYYGLLWITLFYHFIVVCTKWTHFLTIIQRIFIFDVYILHYSYCIILFCFVLFQNCVY